MKVTETQTLLEDENMNCRLKEIETDRFECVEKNQGVKYQQAIDYKMKKIHKKSKGVIVVFAIIIQCIYILSLYLQFLFIPLRPKYIDINNMWTSLSDTAILNQLGARLKAYRISRGLKQQVLATESGVGVSTIAKIESGQSVSFSLLICVLRTLGGVQRHCTQPR